jgi:hypothetical protein
MKPERTSESRMSRKEPSSPPSGERKEWWLGPNEPARRRPWAYEQLLFGPVLEHDEALAAVVDDLREEREELLRLYRALDDHFSRIASLERRLKDLTSPTEEHASPSGRLPAADGGHASAAERSYSLARCEGYAVDSPAGPVGYVEGLRFLSRIDQPDLLEVRGGRFGRQLLLIPIELVDEVQVTEERVLVHSAPDESGDLVSELVDRFRRALHFDQAAS